MFANKRILVVEAEFLVALDIQRMLESAGASDTAFARSVDEVIGLMSQFDRFDLAIIELSGPSQAAAELVAGLAAAGVAVVLTTFDQSRVAVPTGATSAQIIGKPFGEAELLAACLAALATAAPRCNS